MPDEMNLQTEHAVKETRLTLQVVNYRTLEVFVIELDANIGMTLCRYDFILTRNGWKALLTNCA